MNLLQNFVYSFGLNSNQLEHLNQSYPVQSNASFSPIDIQNDQAILTNLNYNSKIHPYNTHENLPRASLNFSPVDKKGCINDNFFPNIENKRVRNMFTASQIEILEKVFEQTHYPDSSMREQLSSRFNLNSMRIQVWFQNRRAKYRKMDSEPKKFTYKQKKFKNAKICAPKDKNLTLEDRTLSSSTNLNQEPESNVPFKSSYLSKPIPQYFNYCPDYYSNQGYF
ncbi:ALX homeobox 1 [Brachionus plicatilis]|uniref:ALX homeobox 1 n=1 Tax=Brachionus plicatilis TaxID=10195 RepID=A0A3M7RCC2_BRAPC|nr:ALX homeobox 1 [Brachionus plicatilis]